MTCYCILQTAALGELLLVAQGNHVAGIYFADCKHAPAIQSDWVRNPKLPVLRQTARELEQYLRGERTNFSLPLHAKGTPFQREIWRQIARIPFGKTLTYSELSKRAGAPRAVRAAGTATGKNPHSIIVPCHRVIAKGGALGGYAGRIERKRRLLEIEKPAFQLAK